MKIFKWKPNLTDEAGSKVFDGYIEISIPPQRERFKLMQKLNFDVVQGKVKVMKDQIEQFEIMKEIISNHVKSVKLKHCESGHKIGSLEELEFCFEYSELVGAIGNTVMGGIRLGEIYVGKSSSK